ncbi:hypothetical protein J0910_30670 [Nocardiopsis sp. CNT-189]|uniref:hypothetical protein n=1 Tax=Nocardiopsis oceanisediminis TaxID=2816862 RepID=UPI003B381962
MTAVRGPVDAALSRRLLAELAAEPAAQAPAAWTAGLAGTANTIRTALERATTDGAEEVAFEDLLSWRNAFDGHLAHMETADPASWTAWRRPGTFLDLLLRLRSLLAHVVGKAYWDDAEHVAFAEIDVERYLWGAR